MTGFFISLFALALPIGDLGLMANSSESAEMDLLPLLLRFLWSPRAPKLLSYGGTNIRAVMS